MHQAEHQADHRGLAFAGRSHERHDLAGLRDEIGIRDDLFIFEVREADVVHPDFHTLFRERLQLLAFRDMPLLGQLIKLPDTVRGDRACEERRHDADHLIKGACEPAALLQEKRHRTVSDLVRPQKEQAVTEGRVLDDQAHDRHEHVRLDREHVVFQADLLELLLPLAELPPVAFGNAEGLNGIEVVKCLHFERHHLTAHLADLFLVVALLPDQELGHKEHDRRRRKREQRHDFVVMPDHRKRDDKVVDRNDDRREPADRVGAHRLHVAVEAAQNIAARILADRLPVDVDDPVKDVGLDIVIDVDAELCRDPVDQAGEQQTEHRTAHHDRDQDPQLFRLVARNHVDHVLADDARYHAQGGAHDAKDHIEHDGPFIALAVAEDPAPVLQDLLKGPVLQTHS